MYVHTYIYISTIDKIKTCHFSSSLILLLCILYNKCDSIDA